MAVSQTETESQAVKLSEEAFDAFCEDIAGMFDIEMECEQQESCMETVGGIKKRFKKLVAVNSVQAKGVLDGTFQLIFDQEGLFTLSGVIVMLPENKILENRRKGSDTDAANMSDGFGGFGRSRDGFTSASIDSFSALLTSRSTLYRR